jgi:hypothetical protein
LSGRFQAAAAGVQSACRKGLERWPEAAGTKPATYGIGDPRSTLKGRAGFSLRDTFGPKRINGRCEDFRLSGAINPSLDRNAGRRQPDVPDLPGAGRSNPAPKRIFCGATRCDRCGTTFRSSVTLAAIVIFWLGSAIGPDPTRSFAAPTFRQGRFAGHVRSARLQHYLPGARGRAMSLAPSSSGPRP